MIIKILEELRQLRIKEDYNNYRTLTNILDEYICIEFCSNTKYFNEDEFNKIDIVFKWIDSEITHISECVNRFLKEKDYKNLKITSQSHNNLQRMKNRLEDSRFIKI